MTADSDAVLERQPGDTAGTRDRAIHFWIWAAAYAALVTFVLYRLDVFPLTTRVQGEGGPTVARAFFTVDHPFHTARAALVESAWRSLDTVRWVANHQGGYPAEFYPFGLSGLAALLSLLSFGTLAIESAWAITIALVFLLPGLAYWLLCRQDRLSSGVGLVALAGQVTIAGATMTDWTHGGFTELVEWGLATNVAGATYALIALPLLVRAVDERSPRWGAAAAVTIALCAVSNPRSLIAVAVVGIAVLVHGALGRELRTALLGVGSVAVVATGLAAPVLIPLVRYRNLYFFLSYQEYANLTAYWHASVDTVTWPVLALAGVGLVLAFVSRQHRATQVAAVSLVLYMAITGLAAAVPSLRALVPQLELPRLMPFQRFLILYLAAYGAIQLIRVAIPLAPRWAVMRDLAAGMAVSVALVLVFATGIGPFSQMEQGLRPVARTEASVGEQLVAFRQAVDEAVAVAPDGTGILVIGSQLSWSPLNWHEQLWAPMEAPGRRFYYNDWLWYWHTRHAGPYDYRNGHYYPNPSETLTEAYLSTHGIGAVMVTDAVDRATGASVRQAAQDSDLLERVTTSGAWDVYRVRQPQSLVTLDGRPAGAVDVSADGESITARFDNAPAGTIRVRQNWFPRWSAKVNGDSVDITRATNGYMEVAVDGGDVTVTLHYGVTFMDTLARVLTVVSLVIVVVALVYPKPMARWARR